MQFKFIAINGDNVGEGIGNAIATDNHEELSKITNGLKEAHGAIEEWAQTKGGQIVTSSGDEAIVKVPADSFDESELDQIKAQYSETAGHTVTIGIGDSMSEASKALIYGKMNDKDQIVEYDSTIDDYIANYDDGMDTEDEDETDEVDVEDKDDDGDIDEVDLKDNTKDDSKALIDGNNQDVEDDIEDMPKEGLEDGSEVPEMEETSVDGEAPNEETDEELPGEDLMDESEIAEEDDDVPTEDRLKEFTDDIDGEEEPSSDAVPEHEKSLSPEDKAIHDSTETMSDEEEIAQEQAAAQVQGDGQPIPGQEQNVSDIDGEENPEDNQSALQDMIHANMEGEEESSQSKDELKQKVASILLSFKENKMALEQMKQSNPRMYESLIGMLESMIDMAKELNMDPEKEAIGMEAMDEVPDANMPVKDGDGDDETAMEEMAEDEVEEEEEVDEDKLENKLIQKFENLTKSIAEFMQGIREDSKKAQIKKKQ